MSNILVIYYSRRFPMRASQRDHLFSFKRHAKKHNCYYINVFVWGLPKFLQNIEFDLIVFSWSFLDNRFTREDYLNNLKKLEPLKKKKCIKIALPQDEFSNTDLLCKTINEFDIVKVYSVSPQSEWKKLYKTVDFEKVNFEQVLTGYLEKSTTEKIDALSSTITRDVDIGYRSGAAAFWGRFNLIKFYIAEKIQLAAVNSNLKLDIAFGWQNFLMGDDWYRFLLRCKYMPGVEGGSSILDWDGTLVDSVQRYRALNPNADFDAVEAACIPAGKDGEINVVALSPRHLEACATRTCQILIEGSYNKILLPGVHYIELKKDFSNLNEVLELVKSDHLRDEIIERAYLDVVASERYSYKTYVNHLLMDNKISGSSENGLRIKIWKVIDGFSQVLVYGYSLGRTFRDKVKKIFIK